MSARPSELAHLAAKRNAEAAALAKALRAHRGGVTFAKNRLVRTTLVLLQAEIRARRPPLGRPRVRVVVDGPSLFGEA